MDRRPAVMEPRMCIPRSVYIPQPDEKSRDWKIALKVAALIFGSVIVFGLLANLLP